MRRAVGEDGTPRAHSGSDAARRSADSLRGHVAEHKSEEPLEVGSPEHQAFEREIQDRQARADVEREGDDFDMVQGIHLAHPDTPNINHLPRPIYTDMRLPKGTVWFKTSDTPIEEFIQEILKDLGDQRVYDAETQLVLEEVRRRQAERMADDPAAVLGHQEQAQPVDHGTEGMHDKLILEIGHRRDVGLARYNSTLQAFNGRDALRDILEELIDGSVYVLQAMTEREQLRAELLKSLLTWLQPRTKGVEYAFAPDLESAIQKALDEVFVDG